MSICEKYFGLFLYLLARQCLYVCTYVCVRACVRACVCGCGPVRPRVQTRVPTQTALQRSRKAVRGFCDHGIGPPTDCMQNWLHGKARALSSRVQVYVLVACSINQLSHTLPGYTPDLPTAPLYCPCHTPYLATPQTYPLHPFTVPVTPLTWLLPRPTHCTPLLSPHLCHTLYWLDKGRESWGRWGGGGVQKEKKNKDSLTDSRCLTPSPT